MVRETDIDCSTVSGETHDLGKKDLGIHSSYGMEFMEYVWVAYP